MTGREDLARRQAALVAALVDGQEPPPGVDPERVRVQAAALAAKRAAYARLAAERGEG